MASCANILLQLQARFGVCWDESKTNQESDADASCLIFDATANLIDIVFFGTHGWTFWSLSPVSASIAGNLTARGEYCAHSGDNRSGSADGDDEKIMVLLDRVPPNVSAFVFVVTCFKGDLPAAAKCTMYNGKKPGFSLTTNAHKYSAVIVSVVARGSTGAWEAKAVRFNSVQFNG